MPLRGGSGTPHGTVFYNRLAEKACVRPRRIQGFYPSTQFHPALSMDFFFSFVFRYLEDNLSETSKVL